MRNRCMNGPSGSWRSDGPMKLRGDATTNRLSDLPTIATNSSSSLFCRCKFLCSCPEQTHTHRLGFEVFEKRKKFLAELDAHESSNPLLSQTSTKNTRA